MAGNPFAGVVHDYHATVDNVNEVASEVAATARVVRKGVVVLVVLYAVRVLAYVLKGTPR
jgi:hypothetical protein